MLHEVTVSRVSEEEFLALPQTQDKVELVDGEIVVSPSPNVWHQKIVGNVYAALRAWKGSQAGPVEVIASPSDVRLRTGRILQPDVYVLFARVPQDHTGPVDIVPALCVEVISGSALYDRVTKRFLYAEAGVREYWVIAPEGRVERWSGPSLQTCQEHVDGILETPLLPGLRLPVSDLFAS